uniref:Zinc finger CCCH domain-containing protein 45 n=1 Tax=Anthurium amnicola TaxID=1678845 RepID=A0A1D1Z9D6_9ARAE
MSREEVTETESQQTTSANKESREIPNSTAAPKKSASHPSLHAQHSQNEQSLTAESSQDIKISSGRKQQKDKNKDIKSNNAYQSISGKDIINNNKSTSNGNTSTKTSDGIDENSSGSFNHDDSISNGDTDHDPFHENENGISIPRRQSMNDNSQRSSKSHSMHQRHNSTPISSSINIVTTNTSISTSPPPSSPSSPPSPSPSNNSDNNDNTNPDNINNNANTSTITSTNTTYSNGINIQSQTYEETPQISYPSMNPTPYMAVPSQYFTPFYPNNGQYFYDPQYNRFGRPPHQIPPSAQQTFVRSNVYPYHQIPVIPQIHPPPYNPSPLIPHQSLPTRYLNPSSATGGDSGFSSRRSSLDQVRTPEFGPQHPPRIHQQKKPKQLDKALWVGNLPDTTTQDELKEFFADENMESVFHIKKSNCAFVNYKTHEAVMEAVHKYNDTEFKDIKLVCRPRKQTPADLKLKTESLSALISENTPPPTPSEAGSTSSTRSRRSSLPPRQRIRQPSIASMSPASSVSSLKPSSQNRYFILKSLTQDDLDISVKSGYWATQPHNEAALNKAFKSAENVYLIFSANKSGEFYGYARMLSPISKETTETVQWTPIDEAALAASSSRLSPNQDELKLRKKFQDEENEDCEDDAVPSRNWGTTFKVEWIKVQKLPFIRTRQLRNPWNANREVKISRDGTEVEPVVGERLLAEFHKSPQTIPTSYSNISGPLLTQPLNIDGQGVGGEGQDRMLTTNGAQIPPIIDPNFMPSAQPTFFTPPPGYWHPQPIIIPPYGAHPAPPGYVPQQAWTASSSKDQPVGVTRVQPAQPSIVTGSPMMPLDQQQYVEVIWGPMQHPSHYQSVPAPHLYQPGAGVHYQQAPPQQYYRPSEDNGHVDNHMSYQVSSQQEQNMSNDQESESHMVSSYLMEEQSAETSSNA